MVYRFLAVMMTSSILKVNALCIFFSDGQLPKASCSLFLSKITFVIPLYYHSQFKFCYVVLCLLSCMCIPSSTRWLLLATFENLSCRRCLVLPLFSYIDPSLLVFFLFRCECNYCVFIPLNLCLKMLDLYPKFRRRTRMLAAA